MPSNSLSTFNTQILYVADAYCGWCWGLAPQLANIEAAQRHQLPFRVISGGLFVGTRSAPMKDYPFIRKANAHITQETGAQFGPAYQRLVEEGSFRMDSVAAARGLAGLRAQAPNQALSLLRRMQEAFYLNGQSLSDPDTYRRIAEAEGLSADEVADYLVNEEGHQTAMADFQLAQSLGVNSYPTLLLLHDGSAHLLPGTGASLAEFNDVLEDLLD